MHMSKKMDTAYMCATCIHPTAPQTPPNLQFITVKQEPTHQHSASSMPTPFVSCGYLASWDPHTPEPDRTSPCGPVFSLCPPHYQRFSLYLRSILSPLQLTLQASRPGYLFP